MSGSPSHHFPPYLSSAHDFLAPLCTRLAGILLDVFLDLLLEVHLVAVIVERDDNVDGITELRDQEQRVDVVN